MGLYQPYWGVHFAVKKKILHHQFETPKPPTTVLVYQNVTLVFKVFIQGKGMQAGNVRGKFGIDKPYPLS